MTKEIEKKYAEYDEVLKNDIVDRHSYFQLKYFVVGKEPTVQAKLWRCLRELKSRRQAIDAILREIEETNDKIELAQLDIEDIDKLSAQNKRHVIQKRQITRRIENARDSLSSLQKKLKENEEEANFFLSAYKKLSEHEKLKSFDDLEAQSDYWNEKLSHEMRLRMLLQQPLDLELMKTILSLDEKSPVRAGTEKLIASINLEKRKALTHVEEIGG